MFNTNHIDPQNIGGTVGSFIIEEDTDFLHNLKSISEDFEAENINIISGFGDILLSSTYRNMYADRLTEGALYENSLFKNHIAEESLMESIGPTNIQYLKLNDAKLQKLVENSFNEVLSEAQAVGALQPFVGITGPLIVRSWINNFYKDVIATEVAEKSIINQQFEDAIFIDAKGEKHKIRELTKDTDRAYSLWKDIERPVTNQAITVPVTNFDIIANTTGASRDQGDTIDLNVGIGSIGVEVKVGDGLTSEVIDVPVDIVPSMEWETFSKIIEVTNKLTVPTTFKVLVSGQIDRENENISIVASPEVKTAQLKGKLSSGNNLKTGSVGYERTSRQIVIPTGNHLATGFDKETIKNMKALHGIDHVAKTIGLMTDTISVMKDAEIKKYIDDSLDSNKGSEWVITSTFNCKPMASYTRTPAEWVRERIVEKLEKMAQRLKRVLNIENLFFKVIGNPWNVRLFNDHVTWVAGDRGVTDKMGGVKLDYSLGIMTKQNNFHILSSDKIKESEGLKILVQPTDGMHKTFTQYEYAFFLDNEYRVAKNSLVPAVMATSMHLTDVVFPLQGQILITNNDLDDFADL